MTGNLNGTISSIKIELEKTKNTLKGTNEVVEELNVSLKSAHVKITE